MRSTDRERRAAVAPSLPYWLSLSWAPAKENWPQDEVREVERALFYIFTKLITGTPYGSFRLNISRRYIDGFSRVLGQAGVTGADGTLFPTQGMLRIDSADARAMLANGSYAKVAVHEIFHAMGFGSFWLYMPNGPFQRDPSGVVRVVGENTLLAYRTIYPGLASRWPTPPIEDVGSAGSVSSHWKDSVFGRELMTSRINSASSGYDWLSGMSLAAMADAGWVTTFDPFQPNRHLVQVDDYEIPQPTAAQRVSIAGSTLRRWWESRVRRR